MVLVENVKNFGAERGVIQPEPLQKLLVVDLTRPVVVYLSEDVWQIRVGQEARVDFIILSKLLCT